MRKWPARIGLGIFFAETNGRQNVGNARSDKYKGSFQTGMAEDRSGQRKWAAIKPAIAAFDPALIARDAAEEARAGGLDHRFNHWTAVRDGLMSAHAALFPQIPAIAKVLPNPIDQMKFFELIQIMPTPTRAALNSGVAAKLQNLQPDDHGISAQQQHFCLRPRRPGQEHRRPIAKSSMPCGCSTTNSKRRWPRSMRSRRGGADAPRRPIIPGSAQASVARMSEAISGTFLSPGSPAGRFAHAGYLCTHATRNTCAAAPSG